MPFDRRARTRPGASPSSSIYAIVGVSLAVLTGWAGQISLGQLAISGIGAAAAGGLAANHDWDFFATLAVAAVAGAFAAMVIGLPALRIQGLFLAVTTLAAAFTVQGIVLSPEYFGWLLPGDFAFVERPVLWGVRDVDADSSARGHDHRRRQVLLALPRLPRRSRPPGPIAAPATARAASSSACATTAG